MHVLRAAFDAQRIAGQLEQRVIGKGDAVAASISNPIPLLS
jgi:hypothetical protein